MDIKETLYKRLSKTNNQINPAPATAKKKMKQKFFKKNKNKNKLNGFTCTWTAAHTH